MDYLTTHTSLSPIRRGAPGFLNIAEILLKVMLNTINQIKSNQSEFLHENGQKKVNEKFPRRKRP
jgi:hypothetical protein